jgi:hypothetical protein
MYSIFPSMRNTPQTIVPSGFTAVRSTQVSAEVSSEPRLQRGEDQAPSTCLERNNYGSALMPSLVRYGSDTGIADEQLRKRLLEIPLAFLEFETGLSRHTIVRARRRPNQYTRDHCDFSRMLFSECQFDHESRTS